MGTNRSHNHEMGKISFLVCAAMLLVGVLENPALSQQGQTREECNACCDRSGLDEYYTDQCKLKCFRNHDHCTGKKGAPPPAAARPPAPQQPRRPTTEASEPRPQRPAQPAPPRRPAAPPFMWPESIVLSPGNEAQVADQILAANGIPRQHPNYVKAMQNIQGILIAFGRANPQGGNLPADELERVITQYR
jgi:hypothetical protein